MSALAALLVAIDIGHHVAAPGVISASGRPEFEYNLDLALEVRKSLEEKGIKTRLIGDRGDYAVLHHRTRDARGADLFVSIHHDSVREKYLDATEKFSGFSLFVSRMNPNAARSLACATAIGIQLRVAGFRPSRYHADPVLGEARPFADEENGVHFFDNLAVAKTAAMPSVLVEAGVIVNRDEDLRMRDPDVRRSLAGAVGRGIGVCLSGK